MSLIDDELAKAETNSVEARQELARTVVALQQKLKPSALAKEALADIREAADEIARSGVDAVKRNPVRSAGIVAAVTALIVRKPLARLLNRKPTDT
jgi:F0F1-type ATP synthase membrane subunit b/b'